MNRSVENIELDYKSDSGYLLAGTELIKYFKRLSLSESSGIRVNAMFGFRLGYTFYK